MSEKGIPEAMVTAVMSLSIGERTSWNTFFLKSLR